MKYKIITLLLLVCFPAAATLYAQNKNEKRQNQATDTTKQQTVDLYKEFNENSFADVGPVKIKDSSLLKQHLIGFKVGYAISSVSFSQDFDHKSIKTPIHFGIYYTYYHSLWKSMPYFGFQTGLEYNEIGYTHVSGNDQNITEVKNIYRAIELPILSQFRVDFWKMRLMLNIGPYAYYIMSSNLEGGIPSTTNRLGAGIMGGGGIAFIFKPIELHIECNYKYALSHFYDPQIYSTEYWLYTHSNQLAIQVGVFYRLGKRGR